MGFAGIPMDLLLEACSNRHCFRQFADRQVDARAHIEKRKVVWSRLGPIDAIRGAQRGLGSTDAINASQSLWCGNPGVVVRLAFDQQDALLNWIEFEIDANSSVS